MPASALLKNTIFIEDWLATAAPVKQRKTEIKLFPATKRSKL